MWQRHQQYEHEKTHAHLQPSLPYHTRYDLYQLYTKQKNQVMQKKHDHIPNECNSVAERDSDKCPYLTLKSHGFTSMVASKLLQLTHTLQEGKHLL